MSGPIRIAVLANGTQARRELNRTATSAGGLGAAFRTAGKGALIGLGALAAAGKGIYEVGQVFDDVSDTIVVGTGASGTALEKLEASAKRIGRTTPSSFADVGTAVADLNTRLGLTGKPLEQMASRVLNLSRITKTDLAGNIEDITRAFGDWGIELRDQPKALDKLFYTSQATGIGLNELAQSVVRMGAPLRQFGFSFEEGIALFGKWAKEGVNTQTVMAGLKIGLGQFSKAGLEPKKALEQTVQAIKDAGTAGEANGLAIKVFGQRAGPDMAAAVREGRFEIDDLVSSIKGSEGAIDDADKRTRDFRENWQLFKNNVLATLAPLAEKAFDAFSRASAKGLDGAVSKLRDLSKWYAENEGSLRDLAGTIRNEAGPALSDLASIAGDVSREVVEVAGPLSRVLLPVLGDLVGLAADAAGAVDSLPGPLQTFAFTAGVAAFAIPRLTAGLAASTAGLRVNMAALGQWTVAARAAETRSTALGLAALRMGGFARQAAGPAGIAGLAVGASQGSSALGVLSSVAGGAALGFSMGGPWGALIGGAGGGLISALGGLSGATDDSADSFKQARRPAEDYRSTLDSLTGATTAATRATIQNALETSGAGAQARLLGLTNRQVVSAVLGNKAALEQVNAATSAGTQLTLSFTDAWGRHRDMAVRNEQQVAKVTARMEAEGFQLDEVRKKSIDLAGSTQLLDFIGQQTQAWQAQSAAKRQEILASQDLSRLYKTIPKNVVTKLEATGVVPTVKGIAEVAARYRLVDKKQLRSLIAVTGVDASVKQVQRVIAKIGEARNTKADLPNVSRGISRSMDDGERAATRGSAKIGTAIEKGTAKTRPNLDGYRPALNNQLGVLATIGSTGGSGIGQAIETGFGSGFAGAILNWSAQLQAAVRAAIAAGRREAKANSPSRETARLGGDLMDGLAVGIAAKGSAAQDKFAQQIRKLLLGATGSQQIGSALDRLSELIVKRIDLKDDKAERRRERAVLKSLQGRYAALRKVGKQQDALQDGNYLAYLKKGSELHERMSAAGVHNLTEARELVRRLREESAAYAASVKQAFVDYASITNLGLSGRVSTKTVLAAMAARVKQAEQFAATIQRLRDLGLNATQLQQLLAAGPESLGIASAIAQGGAAAVGELNALQAQLEATGATLGANMASQFYDAGIASAEGIVAGLSQAQAELDRVAEKMAKALVKAVKKQLGISSPSRVFRGIGRETVRGLVLGLDETYVRRQGERVAKAVVAGYGTPALRTYMSVGGAAAAPVVVDVRATVTSDGLHQLQRGREISADVDAWRSVGGKAAPTPGGAG